MNHSSFMFVILRTDLKKVCRLCLYEGFETEIVSLKENPDLLHKIKECVSLEIDIEQNPSVICVSCLQQLNQWSAFKEVCHRSHNVLLKSINTQNQQELTKTESKYNESNEIKDENHASNSHEDIKPFESLEIDNNDDSQDHISLNLADSPYSNDEDFLCNRDNKKTRKVVVSQREAKAKKRKSCKRNIAKTIHEQNNDVYSDSDMDDTVEALEKYLFKLYQEDTENEWRNEVKQTFNYDCDICQDSFDNIFNYLDHQETHNGQPVFKCQRCEQIFSSRSELVDHDNKHQIPCPKCGKMILPICLYNHMVLHTDRFKCAQCNKRFYNSTLLRQHIESVHSRLKKHVCETCGKSFTSTTSLQTHIKIHSDVRPYACKICEFSGRTASALYAHMAKHENGLHVCEICAKSFKSYRSLRDHTRRVHSEKKNHECGVCQKKFIHQYMLTVHTRTHTGARPYQCNFCDRAFVRSDGLREHLATHGQRNSYNCLQCGKKFMYKRGLGRHTCTVVPNKV